MSRVALITGITGMDGSWLAELLLEKGYIVHGIIRRSATFNTRNIDHIFDKLNLHHGDLTDAMNIHNIIAKVLPDEIYNFGAQSHVKVSHDLENYTFQTNTLGVLNILQSVRCIGLKCKIYQASTSEEFGNSTDGTMLLNEDSPKVPVSVYGISKLAAEHLCRVYRDAYNMFIVSSTLFNHESERRGHTFVTQKIADYVAKYITSEGKTIKPLQLGNLNARRDWGSAKLYVQAIWLMMQQEKSENFVIATGETHNVREFVELAFKSINVQIEWIGSGKNEVGIDKNTREIIVEVNSKYYRDIDIECLIGDASKAKKQLGWSYDMKFEDLVKEIVDAAVRRKT